jgi:adenine-specific DNA-methyltransferase
LNLQKVQNYDDLNSLFFSVLARKQNERNQTVQKIFAHVPYLNSSLFEPTDNEQVTICINNLRNENLQIFSSTILKDSNGKKRIGEINALEYLFEFLNAYDFSSETGEEIQEENKRLINAAVLGLIFEKINGYKDGSFFTPGFITMYMCRETIRRAVVQKFNEVKGWSCENINDLYDQIEDRKDANTIINSLKICDPAVGSGHFLVSALNEIIAIKSELKILLDREGKRLKEYDIEVVNDELIILDEDGLLFEYNPKSKESQRVQETLFHEKQTIIEGCLFGVDINPNSVKICRLRLWIELLKNAYYKTSPLTPFLGGEGNKEEKMQELETLPNIDINIKCGNSLISRFSLDTDLRVALNRSKCTIESYRNAVQTYRNAENKEQKREMERFINDIKGNLKTILGSSDPNKTKLRKLEGEVENLETQTSLFEETKSEKTKREKKITKLNNEIDKLRVEIEDIESGKIYENAFEWRFEFPEVLNNDGFFVGFDVVIGNPPYIRQEEIKNQKPYLQTNFITYSGTADLYVFFVEQGFKILKAKGQFCYIMPNKWMQAGYGKALRTYLLENQLQGIIDFGDVQVFEEATTYPCILNASKQSNNSNFISAAVKTLNYSSGFPAYLQSISNQITVETLNDETWVISSDSDQKLLSRIKNNCVSLAEYINGEAHYGIKTGLTEAFLVNDDEKDRMVIKDPQSWELLKPVLRGRTIKKWYAEQDNLWLIGTFPVLNIDIDNYPEIRDYLLKFGKKRLEQSGEEGSRKKTSGEWFETQDNIAYYQEFEKPKIMYQTFQIKPCFIYDEQGLYCNNSMWIISKADKVLLAILNSKVGWWLISKYCTAIQNGFQLIWKYFGQIPIPVINSEQSQPIILLVDKILTAKKSDPNADTTALETEIDQLVYQLYELTAEEIKIIEG